MFLANMLVEDEARHAARQPHRRGPQRLVALHRRRRPGREQHPPLDHRERLAGGDRRPAAQHVLQHRHRHLHLGADQPQAGAPPGQGAAHRRHRVVQAAAQEPRQEELRAVRRRHRAHLRHLPRLRGDRAVEDLPQRGLRLLEGHGRAAAARVAGIDPHRAYTPEGDQGAARTKAAIATRTAPPGHPQESTSRARPRPIRCAACSRPRSTASAASSNTSRTATCATPRQVPLLEPGGIEAFIRREVLPHAPDAWIDEAKTTIGYEISFTRYFYKPQPLAVRWRRSAPTSWRWSARPKA